MSRPIVAPRQGKLRPLMFIADLSRFFVSLWKDTLPPSTAQRLRCDLDCDLMQIHHSPSRSAQSDETESDKGCEDAALICKKNKIKNDFRSVSMNLASLITLPYFLSAYSSRSVVASLGPFVSFWNVIIFSCAAWLETYSKSRNSSLIFWTQHSQTSVVRSDLPFPNLQSHMTFIQTIN